MDFLLAILTTPRHASKRRLMTTEAERSCIRFNDSDTMRGNVESAHFFLMR